MRRMAKSSNFPATMTTQPWVNLGTCHTVLTVYKIYTKHLLPSAESERNKSEKDSIPLEQGWRKKLTLPRKNTSHPHICSCLARKQSWDNEKCKYIRLKQLKQKRGREYWGNVIIYNNNSSFIYLYFEITQSHQSRKRTGNENSRHDSEVVDIFIIIAAVVI